MSYKIKRERTGWYFVNTEPSVVVSDDDFEITMTEEQLEKAEINVNNFNYVAHWTKLKFNKDIDISRGMRIGHMYRDPRTTERLRKSGIKAAMNSKHHDWEAIDTHFYDAKNKRIRNRNLFSKIAKYIAKNYGFMFSEIIVYDWGIHLGFVSLNDLERGKKKYWKLN